VSRSDEGRARLHRWAASRPPSFYEADPYLRWALSRRLGPEALARLEPALRQAGADAAGPIDRAAGELDRPAHLPRLETWSALGDRVDEVVFHPLHHEVGRLVWRSGVLSVLGEPGRMTEHAALVYLFAHHGEVPHLCSIACTAGLVKVLQRAGDERMRRQWLPRLLERDYDRRWHGAQFLTEVQGGSDVGANACVARPDPGQAGAFRVYGEKWFCSNVTADLYAVSARPDGASDGSAGLGLFIVPRRLDDGRPNGVRIRRLKDKLGTRTLPTAEIDLDGALAWPCGRLDEGFKLMMGLVINTSRVEVALGCCGIMRRAWLEAWHYARAREAFDRRLVDFPAIAQQLAEMRALATAGLASTLFVTALEDRLTVAGERAEDHHLYRTAVNLNKYLCSIDAGLVVHHAIEILGGNGTIEDFSPLPRLYREVPVQESWEGPHNTLMAQVLRDAMRAKMHAAVLGAVEALLLGVQAAHVRLVRTRAQAALEQLRGRLERLLRGDPGRAGFHARDLMARLGRLFQVAVLLDDAQEAEHQPALRWLPSAVDLLLRRYVEVGREADAETDWPDTVGRVLEDA
jgi:alkylation response protein AidB-like acyl-CoA dehydrogenase